MNSGCFPGNVIEHGHEEPRGACKMNTCTKVRALRSCSGDVHVARVVVSLVVHAVVGLTLGLIAHVVVVVIVVEFP